VLRRVGMELVLAKAWLGKEVMKIRDDVVMKVGDEIVVATTQERSD
jgi:hypothetical protein